MSLKVPQEEIRRRIERLRKRMEENDVEGALIFQNVDLFYFTGTMQEGVLFLSLKEEFLLIRRFLPRAEEETPLEKVLPFRSLREIGPIIRDQLGGIPLRIGLELDLLPVRLYRKLEEALGGVEFVDLSPLILDVRKIKSPWEASLMEKAGEIGKAVYDRVPEFIKKGMSELEVAGKMISLAMSLGHQEYLRMRGFGAEAHSWHILSGYTGGILSRIDAPMGGAGPSPAYPVGASPKVIGPHEPILIDFGTCYFGYLVDETRCFSLGPLPQKFRDAFKAAKEIEEEVITMAKPGVSCQELFEKGWKVARRLGYEEVFMGPKRYKTSFIGHGIGLELNEPPFIAEGHDYPLEEGMTFALEPKMVFMGEGAVGIENTYLVTASGVKKLTPAPEELKEIKVV
ncbi:MAG: aminopeptidase P family protein [Deltaproteobacteria bacterium]|nr:MAG: aminopeptidase P family protein [Deltaproteobacteria bacterium]